MTRVEGVCFDLDYTLWDLDEVIPRAEQALHAYLARRHPALTARYSVADFREMREQLAEQEPAIAHDLTELRLRVLRQAARVVGEPEALAEPAFTVFLEARNRVTLYPDSEPVLGSLRRRYSLLALTNGNADVHRIGLGHYFIHTISAIEAGAAKPSPAVFRMACERSGLTPAAMVHVGDDPLTDVTGAARFGMRAVWLNRDAQPWPEDLEPVSHVEIRSLSELPELL